MHSKKKVSGVITVFVSLMLVCVLSLGTLALEAGRFQAAKTQLAEANISASSSMIAAYDAKLYDRYGLLAIDNEVSTLGRCKNYLEFNSDLTAGYRGNNLTRMYSTNSVEMQGMYNLTYPGVLKRQILTRAKYNINPNDFSFNYYNMDSFLSDLQMRSQFVAQKLAPVANGSAAQGSLGDINPQMLNAITALYSTFSTVEKFDADCDVNLSSSSVALLPSSTGTVESEVPDEDIQDINNAVLDAKTVLGSSASIFEYTTPIVPDVNVTASVNFVSNMTGTIKDVKSISDMPATSKDVASKCVTMAQGINAAVNMLQSDREGNLLLNSYIAHYFSNRNNTVEGYMGPVKGITINGTDANATFAGACVEYVFGGSTSEKTNQQIAYDYVAAIRLINNLYITLNNSNSINYNNAYSVMGHIAWAYYETCVDVELLANYGAVVPLYKYNMILPVNNPGAVASAFGSKNIANAMSSLGIYNGTSFVVGGSDQTTYKDSLALALWIVPNSDKLLRVADLIQLEMRYREAHVENKTATFLMSEQNTFCRVKVTAKMNAILPVITTGSNSGVNGTTFQSIKYAGY